MARGPASGRDPLLAMAGTTPPPSTLARAMGTGQPNQSAQPTTGPGNPSTAGQGQPVSAIPVTTASPDFEAPDFDPALAISQAAEAARASSAETGAAGGAAGPATAAMFTSTAVPTAAVAGRSGFAPVSRLIATKIRQKRRRQLVTWMTLAFVVLLFIVMATMLVGLNRTTPTAREPVRQVSITPATTLSVFKVGPAQWMSSDDQAYDLPHTGPITFGDYGLTPDEGTSDTLLVGTAVCQSYDIYDQPRLQVYLLDGGRQIYTEADISLPPMSGQSSAGRQPISLVIPEELHNRFSSLDWHIIPGLPLNDGKLLSPQKITRTGVGNHTELLLTVQNTLDKPIYKLSVSIRPVDDHGKPLAHWQGQWQGTLEPEKALNLRVATPLARSLPAVADWRVSIAAELSLEPKISVPNASDAPDTGHDDFTPKTY